MGNVEVVNFSLSPTGFFSAPPVFPSHQRLTQIQTPSGTNEHQSRFYTVRCFLGKKYSFLLHAKLMLFIPYAHCSVCK